MIGAGRPRPRTSRSRRYTGDPPAGCAEHYVTRFGARSRARNAEYGRSADRDYSSHRGQAGAPQRWPLAFPSWCTGLRGRSGSRRDVDAPFTSGCRESGNEATEAFHATSKWRVSCGDPRLSTAAMAPRMSPTLAMMWIVVPQAHEFREGNAYTAVEAARRRGSALLATELRTMITVAPDDEVPSERPITEDVFQVSKRADLGPYGEVEVVPLFTSTTCFYRDRPVAVMSASIGEGKRGRIVALSKSFVSRYAEVLRLREARSSATADSGNPGRLSYVDLWGSRLKSTASQSESSVLTCRQRTGCQQYGS